MPFHKYVKAFLWLSYQGCEKGSELTVQRGGGIRGQGYTCSSEEAEEVVLPWGVGEVKGNRDGSGLVMDINKKIKQLHKIAGFVQ